MTKTSALWGRTEFKGSGVAWFQSAKPLSVKRLGPQERGTSELGTYVALGVPDEFSEFIVS